MNILITGGCGYTGTLLTELLLDIHNVTVVDTQWFGNFLKPRKNLNIIKTDIRNIDTSIFEGIDTIVHLASIANDPGVDLNQILSWEVNVLATQKVLKAAVKKNVKHFIYASSGSVYGIKDEKQVTEELDLVPISTYNKTKMIAERVILCFKDKIKLHIIRPATVCGYSPRMRLDVTVNMFVFQALHNKLMTVFGGKQVRPNIHILDIINVYKFFIENSEIDEGVYNAGFENLSLINIAKKIKNRISGVDIKITESNDERSYRLNSNKLISVGFEKKYNVDYAIEEMINRYHKGDITEKESSFTVKWMKSLKLDKL